MHIPTNQHRYRYQHDHRSFYSCPLVLHNSDLKPDRCRTDEWMDGWIRFRFIIIINHGHEKQIQQHQKRYQRKLAFPALGLFLIFFWSYKPNGIIMPGSRPFRSKEFPIETQIPHSPNH
ncbi:hypothetical protein VTJ04DRAFT_7959 [Mycothermus thermophilus]|uniref:uncharacterized protein n=1 Tax=Humicola insolens TaxID=85995 RepID=UPI0037448F6C